jgi:molecular chaperone GrpE (heat shock protein)
LERAAAAVPSAALDGSEPLEAERAAGLLKSLLEGVRMTQGTLMAVFKKHGVEQYDPAGEAFDPNMHSAMFEVPDASKEAGRVAVVTKVCVGLCVLVLVVLLLKFLSSIYSHKPHQNTTTKMTQPTPKQRGYKMHDRVLRAAEVGVYRAP